MGDNIVKRQLDAVTARNEYVSGSLSPARHAIVALQCALSPGVKAEVEFQDAIAAGMLMREHYAPMSPDFFAQLMPRLNRIDDYDYRADDIKTVDLADRGQDFSERYLENITWKTVFPGVAVHHIMSQKYGQNGERLYFLKIKGGMKMPNHSHHGEEWALIIKGSYSCGGLQYERGDIHIANDNDLHAPHVDAGDPCICLVMSQGPIKMKNWQARLLQPLIGI